MAIEVNRRYLQKLVGSTESRRAGKESAAAPAMPKSEVVGALRPLSHYQRAWVAIMAKPNASKVMTTEAKK